jgi:hypothetical protein
VTHHNKTKLGWCCPSSTKAVVIKIEICNHWMAHCRLYISTTDFNYKISAKGHYVKLLRTKLYGKREGSVLRKKNVKIPKGVIRNRISKKDRQYNYEKGSTNNDLQSITEKTKDQ